MNEVKNLAEHQVRALEEMHNGCVLCGTVGSGKSRTALAYYIYKVCRGSKPLDLYIITTAQKRDKHEWEDEMYNFIMPKVKIIVDSWNNIKKYGGIYDAFFIFDEQRVVGSGPWVKTFLRICNRNKWVLLSATPGDKWKDYIPLFIANGFYRNKTDFGRQHIIYDPFITKYPKIKGYINEGLLIKHRKDILIPMKDMRHTERHITSVKVDFNKQMYRQVMKTHVDPYTGEPIQEVGKFCHILRRVTNSDVSRRDAVLNIINKYNRVIVFYNYDFERDILINTLISNRINYSEWNGHAHEQVLSSPTCAYLVQYTAGCEGWNCISINAMIFFSLNYSYKVMIQAMGRIDRMNTPFKDLYYFKLVSNSRIDQAIVKSLENGKMFNEKAFAECQKFA